MSLRHLNVNKCICSGKFAGPPGALYVLRKVLRTEMRFCYFVNRQHRRHRRVDIVDIVNIVPARPSSTSSTSSAVSIVHIVHRRHRQHCHVRKERLLKCGSCPRPLPTARMATGQPRPPHVDGVGVGPLASWVPASLDSSGMRPLRKQACAMGQ